MKEWKEITLKYMSSCDRKDINEMIKNIKKQFGRKVSSKILLRVLVETYFAEIVGNIRSALHSMDAMKGNCCYNVPSEKIEMQEKGFIEDVGSYYDMYQYKLDKE